MTQVYRDPSRAARCSTTERGNRRLQSPLISRPMFCPPDSRPYIAETLETLAVLVAVCAMLAHLLPVLPPSAYVPGARNGGTPRRPCCFRPELE